MKIDFTVSTIIEVVDSQIEQLVYNNYGINFSFHACMECQNATYHRFDVTGEFNDEDERYIKQIENNLTVPVGKVDVLMNWLADKGDIDTGIYLVSAWIT